MESFTDNILDIVTELDVEILIPLPEKSQDERQKEVRLGPT